jgi:hypothetical protein
MESNSKFKEILTSITDFLNEQAWYQDGKGKWEELDPASRQYLKLGAMGSALLLCLIFVVSSVWSVHSLKNEVAEKQELLNTIQTANEELRKLRETTGNISAASAGGGNWSSYFETVATTAGIDKAALSIGGEKPGSSSETSKETLYDVAVKHVSIKQVVRFAFGLESGGRPVKLRNLSIDTKADPQGYMDATLALSGFAMVAK